MIAEETKILHEQYKDFVGEDFPVYETHVELTDRISSLVYDWVENRKNENVQPGDEYTLADPNCTDDDCKLIRYETRQLANLFSE